MYFDLSKIDLSKPYNFVMGERCGGKQYYGSISMLRKLERLLIDLEYQGYERKDLTIHLRYDRYRYIKDQFDVIKIEPACEMDDFKDITLFGVKVVIEDNCTYLCCVTVDEKK